MSMTNSYIDRIAAEIRRVVDPDATASDEDLPLYRLYALLSLAKGKSVTAEDVHNAWAVWASEYSPEHRNLLPFKELSLSVQGKDNVYAEVIHQVVDTMQLGKK